MEIEYSSSVVTRVRRSRPCSFDAAFEEEEKEERSWNSPGIHDKSGTPAVHVASAMSKPAELLNLLLYKILITLY